MPITPKNIARNVGAKLDGKAIRRHIRNVADDPKKYGAEAAAIARVGQGNRYAFDARQARLIENTWRKAHGMKPIGADKPKAQRKPKAQTPAVETPAATPATPANNATDAS